MDYSQYKKFELRRKFWKLFGAEISVIEPTNEAVIGFIKMKAWKLREDVRFYTDKTMQQEVFAIHARQIIDISATYDVIDSASQQPIFALKRRGLKSIFVRDHWDILDNQGNIVGAIQETSGKLALIRRWLGMISDLFDLIFMFVIQTYDITINDNAGTPAVAARITHRKNPFVVKMSVDSTAGPANVDPRVIMASASMLSIVDAAKNN